MPEDSTNTDARQLRADSCQVAVSPQAAPADGTGRRREPPQRSGDTLTYAHISPRPYSSPYVTPVTYTDYGKRRAALTQLKRRTFSGGPDGVSPRPPRRLKDGPVKPRKGLDSGNLQFWVDGSMVKVSKPSGSCNHGGGGKRGKIAGGISRGSRRRMQQKMAMLIRSVLPVFVTFTYPSEYSPHYTQWKKHLDTWAKRLHRKYAGAGLIWRLEPQKRGAPHYHLLIFGVELTPELREWMAQSWFEVVGSGDVKHLAHGSNVQAVRSWRGVSSYTSKYMAKMQAPVEDGEVDWSTVGRWWGVKYAKNLPFSEVVGGEGLTYREAAICMRYLRRFLKSQGVRVSGSLPGMTVYVSDPGRWMDVLDRLLRE